MICCCSIWSGLRGSVLQWFRSYLSDRSFQVVFCGSTLPAVFRMCSVPQASVLGPRLFILFTADLADVAAKRDVKLHSSAPTLSYTYIVVVVIHLLPWIGSKNVSQKSDNGCRPIVSSLMLTRRNCSGPDQSTVLPTSAATDRHYG